MTTADSISRIKFMCEMYQLLVAARQELARAKTADERYVAVLLVESLRRKIDELEA